MGLNILLVLNDTKIKDILKMTFRDDGHYVDFAVTTESAIEKGRFNDYNAIFVDKQDLSLDAIKICTEIKAKRPRSKFIAMIGFNGIYGCEECKNAGYTSFFPKSYDVQDLIRASRNAIRGA